MHCARVTPCVISNIIPLRCGELKFINLCSRFADLIQSKLWVSIGKLMDIAVKAIASHVLRHECHACDDWVKQCHSLFVAKIAYQQTDLPFSARIT